MTSCNILVERDIILRPSCTVYRIAGNIGSKKFGELLLVAAWISICSYMCIHNAEVVANGLNFNFGGILIWWLI